MAEVDSTYTTDVGILQGATTFFMKAAGIFKFFDTDITGDELRGIFRSDRTLNRWDVASMGTASGAKEILTPAYGTVLIQDMAANESGYLSLIAASLGDELIFITHNNTSNAEVTVGMTGINTASLYNLSNVRCSALKFSMSTTNGSCFIRLKCFSDGVWSITELNTKDNNVLALPEA
jgi:hypothetical protein